MSLYRSASTNTCLWDLDSRLPILQQLSRLDNFVEIVLYNNRNIYFILKLLLMNYFFVDIDK